MIPDRNIIIVIIVGICVAIPLTVALVQVARKNKRPKPTSNKVKASPACRGQKHLPGQWTLRCQAAAI